MKEIELLKMSKHLTILSVLLCLVVTINGQGDRTGGGKSPKSKTDTVAFAAYSGKAKTKQNESRTIPTLLQADDIVKGQKSRVKDGYGSGQYGSSRDKGKREHDGIDIVVAAGEEIFSPIKGEIVREAVPYGNDPNYKGIVIKGIEKWKGYEIKIFYAEGLFSGMASPSQKIGNAQNIKAKYPGITNHIHLEVRLSGILIDPFTIWQYSF